MKLHSASCLGILSMLATGHPVHGQSDGWEKVQAISMGTKIEISLPKDKTVSGTLAQVSDVGLALERNGSSM